MVSASGVVMLALLATVTYAQRPGFAPFPWDHMYTQPSDGSTTQRAPTTQQSAVNTGNNNNAPASGTNNNGLIDRFGANNGNVVFRYFNNVPIQGPEAPCVGCTYQLTNRGFIRLSNPTVQQFQTL